MNEKQRKYAIRKTTLGVGSVLIGFVFLGTSIYVCADEATSTELTTEAINNGAENIVGNESVELAETIEEGNTTNITQPTMEAPSTTEAINNG
ncbi:YSIRK-type signal peptide-containing protein, partial [Enterococcus sp. 5B3_DIV0040]|uniref:YSIRK-type signal peptide-containing protein n=1 Tax=Enterococcus sp. 5B3_DIV0040 TaxID=1834182 RepID=UPI000B6C98C5